MATLTMTDGDGLPLQLTTITVAVPSPLSPNTTSMLNAPGVSISGGNMGQVTPLTLPVSQQDCAFKWKYEQSKPDKIGTTLVRKLPSSSFPFRTMKLDFNYFISNS